MRDEICYMGAFEAYLEFVDEGMGERLFAYAGIGFKIQ